LVLGLSVFATISSAEVARSAASPWEALGASLVPFALFVVGIYYLLSNPKIINDR
jgi:hypothetical protein